MVTFGSTSETSTVMRKYTRDLYARLEAETGQNTGWKPVGFIEVAGDRDRLEEYRRVSVVNRHCGVDVHEISPGQVKDLFPLARVDDLLAGFYVMEDGRADPVGATMALAKGARQAGALLLENTPVSEVLTKNGAVRGARTAQGEIACEFVVNCAGMWARQLGAQNGIAIPNQAAEHYYLITERIPELRADWPVLEDPGSYGYFREEVGGLMIGMFEPVCAPWNVRGIPGDFSFGEIQPDWERMGPYLEKAMARVPISMNAGVKKFFCGPESFTPDLQPIVGEAPEVKNYFVAAGLNSIGILTGGGLGRVRAHWILTGSPDVDITAMDIKRLHHYQTNADYRRLRTVESLGWVYSCHYPTRTPQTARGAKRSPFYERLAARGAYFRDVSGWEGADYYAGAGERPEMELTFGKPSWFALWAAEHRAAREGVIVMDMSFMAKLLVEGSDEGRLLEHISANHVDGEPGRLTYTQWLDHHGKLQADLTVTKLAADKYWVVASDTAHRHVETWMKRAFADHHAFVADMTGAYAQLNIQGPRSRELMQLVTTADMTNEAFPFRAAREVDIGFARVLVLRVTKHDKHDNEHNNPTKQAHDVYDRIVAAGEQVGLVHAGLKTLASCRMEKAYRDYGHDIDNTDTVLEAGLGFAVDLKKPDFVGKASVVAQKADGPLKKRLVQVLVKDPEALLFHAEIIRRDGVELGYVRAASYGHTLGGAVGLAMLVASEPIDAKFLESGTRDVQFANTRYPITVSLRPLFDPTNSKVRG